MSAMPSQCARPPIKWRQALHFQGAEHARPKSACYGSRLTCCTAMEAFCHLGLGRGIFVPAGTGQLSRNPERGHASRRQPEAFSAQAVTCRSAACGARSCQWHSLQELSGIWDRLTIRHNRYLHEALALAHRNSAGELIEGQPARTRKPRNTTGTHDRQLDGRQGHRDTNPKTGGNFVSDGACTPLKCKHRATTKARSHHWSPDSPESPDPTSSTSEPW